MLQDVCWWNVGAVADNKTDEERLSGMSLTERRTSKFFNRALPDPPSAPSTHDNTAAQKGTCPDESNNLYELISQSTPEDDTASAAETANAGEMYEDIDNCLERTDVEPSSQSSHQSSTGRSSSIQHPSQNPPDDEYLEPVIPPEEEIRHSVNWRPSPAPRSSLSIANEVLQTSYVNTEMMSTELPSLTDGFTAMAKICQDALKQVAESMTSQYVSASWPTSCRLEWSDFELFDDGCSKQIQQHISYYRARHATLAPNGCVLMVRLLAICTCLA